MASIPKVVTAQRSFAAGEPDSALKRADDNEVFKRGARQARNWRILNTEGLSNRPGRSIVLLEGPRVEEVLMTPTQLFRLVFGNLYLSVYNAAGTRVFHESIGIPWNTATVKDIVWTAFERSIIICFQGIIRPILLTWDGVSQSSTWTRASTGFAERIDGSPFSNQKRTPFFRLSPRGVFCLPTQLSGVAQVSFGPGMKLTSAHQGTRIRFIGKQIFIDTVVNDQVAVCTIVERLFGSQICDAGAGFPANFFAAGDIVTGQTTGLRGIVVGAAGDHGMQVQLLQYTPFLAAENLVGPNGALMFSAFGASATPSQTIFWDDEVMNTMRGFPASCFVDQGRLGFCDFPALPELIVWSSSTDPTDLYTDENNAGPTNAIQELVPGKPRVRYVVPGAESSEFVFCDNAVYYVPITPANPLEPGRVAFNQLTSGGCAAVQPRLAKQSIIYVGTGGDIKAVQAVGAFSRPYVVEELTELHAHLLTDPMAVAIPPGSDQFAESYLYVLNADGTMVVGKYEIKNGLIVPGIGWLPWSGGGTATWVSVLNSTVLIAGTYAPNGIGAVKVCERVDIDQYLDAAMRYNAAPAALAPPVGKGPLWWMAGGTVDLMDGPLGTRMMGTYQVDANGFLIPQNNAGENFTSVNLRVGQTWTATLEPFVPAVPPGQDVNQRMMRRRIPRFQIYVKDSSGFAMVRFFGGPSTRTSPAIGTVMALRRVPAWNQDDDPTQPPPLRDQAYFIRPLGRAHDPRVGIIKDTPGPLTILETDIKVTV